jgi:hypothetical protein
VRDVLVIQAASLTTNPTLDQAIIDQDHAEDPARAAAEWEAEFRRDIESFLSRESVEAAVVPGLAERPPCHNTAYFAFCDPSGGSSDSMTLAIAHREDDLRVLDCVRERRPPFSPEAVVSEFAAELRRYRLGRVTGDKYAASWVVEAFRKVGIEYVHAEKTRSELYLEPR